VILDDPYSYDKVDSQEEREANQFAADTLLPESMRAQVPAGRLTHRDVISLAVAAGVSPGIVVGQLQFRNRIQRDHLNRLKRRYKWNGPNLEIA
jgi:Zn-dependent peptidase ImmA (M78 family)